MPSSPSTPTPPSTTQHARLIVDPAFELATVPDRLFGSFVEHLGRCVYTGIYEPGHPTADEDGFRQDVIDLVRELGVTTIRYPGGNFVSGYDWQDGVGPKADRPRRLDLAWHSTETNQFGLHEMAAWLSKLGGNELMEAVNLGTRGLPEALDLLEYANIPEGTARAEQRKANGADDPFNIRMWCLGNEMDGDWQLGHKDATDYGKLAASVARGMRMVDPDLELVVCGSSAHHMPTFGTWEQTVLTHAYEQVDFISAHAYYWPERRPDGTLDLASFLASGEDMDAFIKEIGAAIDATKSRLRSRHDVHISFDEWNVWYEYDEPSKPPVGVDNWPVAPHLLEDVYSAVDAVVVGDLLVTLLRNADRVRAACLAQLVNVIAPIMTEPGGPAWRQSTFHPFALAAAAAKGGTVLEPKVECASVHTERYGEVRAVNPVAVRGADGSVNVLVTNRSLDDVCTLDIQLPAAMRATEVRAHRARGRPGGAQHARRPGARGAARERQRDARRRLRVRHAAAGQLDGGAHRVAGVRRGRQFAARA